LSQLDVEATVSVRIERAAVMECVSILALSPILALRMQFVPSADTNPSVPVLRTIPAIPTSIAIKYRKRLQSAVRIRIVRWIRPVISKFAKILVSNHLNILAAAMPDVKLNSTVQFATVPKDGVVILMIDASDLNVNEMKTVHQIALASPVNV
jgi:hypothetical protein